VRKFGAPIADLIRPRSYLKMITQADLGAPAGRFYYEKGSTLSDLSDEAIEVIVAFGSACTSPLSHVLIQHIHGAASRVGPTETAFALRGESYVICMVAAWDGREGSQMNQHIEWTRTFWWAMEPFASSGVYVNFLGNESEGRVRASYGVNYARLAALKKRYDPGNFFQFNQNIKPAR
jgi:Berberine and berberine like